MTFGSKTGEFDHVVDLGLDGRTRTVVGNMLEKKFEGVTFDVGVMGIVYGLAGRAEQEVPCCMTQSVGSEQRVYLAQELVAATQSDRPRHHVHRKRSGHALEKRKYGPCGAAQIRRVREWWRN